MTTNIKTTTESTVKTKSTYFRISLTDSCNLNCYFCHNEGQEKGFSRKVQLTADDIVWTAARASEMGYTKFKLTGGEPSRHPEIMEIIRGISALGVEDLSMITNGHRLKENAPDYRLSGLHRLNVSLYSLDPVRFRKNNGGTPLVLQRVIDGIDKAIECGYSDLKLNYVWDGPENFSDFISVCGFAAQRNLTVVLLPLMKFGAAEAESQIELNSLYMMLVELGIASEKTITDAEGISKKLVTLKDGAKILIRVEELREKLPFSRCTTCIYKGECREGIFPTRMSANGALHPCLADTTFRIPLLQSVKNRDAEAVRSAFIQIREL